MQKKFQGFISGKKIFLPLLLSMLVIFVSGIALMIPIFRNPYRPGIAIYGLYAYYALIFISVIVSIFIYYVFIKETIGGIALDEKPDFGLSGISFFLKILLWHFLSTITLGLYMPWYIRNLMKLIGDNTSYKGKVYHFIGKPRELLGRYIAVWVVMLVTTVYYSRLMVGANPLLTGNWSGVIVSYLMMMAVQFILQAIVIIWIIDLEYDGQRITYRGSAVRLVGKMAAESLLAIITLGIYAPAATFGIVRYIINQIDYGDNGRLVQEGKKLEFLGWAWLQIILCVITLGIYTPWAYAKLMNLIVDETCLAISEEVESFLDETAV